MWYIVTTRHTDLRIREGPSTNARIIGGLPQGDPVEVLDNQPVEPRSRAPGWKKLAARGWAYAGDHGEFLRLEPAAAEPARDILLFFGGAGPNFPPGEEMTPNDALGTRTSKMAYDHFVASNQFAHKKSWNSEVDNGIINRAVTAGLTFLDGLDGLDLLGRLVIYGFSAGGFNAVRLCERLTRRVDLLITVDPCIQDKDPNERFQIRTPSPPVVEHFNWYQRAGGYRGRSIRSPAIDHLVVPPNPPRGGRSRHDQMPTFTKNWVQTEIGRILWGQAAGLLHVPQ